MTKTARSLILVSLQVAVLVVSGCASPKPATVTRMSMPDNTPTLTNAPTIPATRTPRPTFTPVPSLTAIASATPAASPAAAGPLSEEGPWLFFAANQYLPSQCCGGVTVLPTLYFINSDGSGKTFVQAIPMEEDMEGLLGFANPNNQLTRMAGADFIFRQGQEKAYIINNAWLIDTWHKNFIEADGRSGFLAIISEGSAPNISDLVIYHLPDLEIRRRIPLVVCPTELPNCLEGFHYQSQMNSNSRSPVGGMEQLSWSRDGRYLAFAAIRSSMSSDLYLYDSTNGNVRELTGGTEDIGKIWWSPDAKWIIFESLSETQQSLWAITLDGKQSRQFYSVEKYGLGLNINQWIDTDSFLSQNGEDWYDDTKDLRLINLESGKVTPLYGDNFYNVEYDRNTGAILFLQPYWNDWYWFTVSNPTPIPMNIKGGSYNWDSRERAIIFDQSGRIDTVCPANEYAVWSLDTIHCRPKPPAPVQVDLFPCPDGLWQVQVNDGIWLEKVTGERIGRVGQWQAGQVIWRPDSLGFFLDVKVDQRYSLYYVSIPDLTLSLVDDHVVDKIFYQWLDADSH